MKVLVADKFEKSGIEGLGAIGAIVDYQPDLKDAALGDAIRTTEADVLVVRSTKVTADMVQAGRLGLIIRAGAGYNTIDVKAASKKGIYVANCPGKNALAVAELAFGLILSCDRRIPDNVRDLRAGKWNKKEYSRAAGLYGRTLGLIGLGNIGQEMIPRAKAFGMDVVCCSRWLTPEVASALGIGRAATPIELAGQCEAISVHVSLNPATKGMLANSFFEAMKPGAIFVNTSRAEVIDQAALLRAIETKNVIAGLDVFEDEPEGGDGTYDGPLRDHARVYCTHHIGASTEQAQEAVAAETVRIVKEFRATGVPPNLVNVSKGGSATHVLVVRHADRVGVLAAVLEVLKSEGISVQEMENIVLGGAQAAIAQISVDKEPSEAALHAIKMDPRVFDAGVFAMEREPAEVK